MTEDKRPPFIELRADGFHCPECGRNMLDQMRNGHIALSEDVTMRLTFGQHYPPGKEHFAHIEVDTQEEADRIEREEMCHALDDVPGFVLVPAPDYDELKEAAKDE